MKAFKALLLAVAAVLLVSSCGLTANLTSNLNLNQTDVVLTQNNFEIVKTVSTEVSATYICGIGGLSKKALQSNAVAELTKKAELKGSQALTNVTVKQNIETYLGVYTKVTYLAEGTVVEFK